MKVAIVHDYLNQYGGAERVLETLLEIWPDADVHTLIYDKKNLPKRLQKQKVYYSFLNNFTLNKFYYEFFLPLYPIAVEKIDTRKYDLIISSSSAWTKGIISNINTCHITYCYNPMRFAWDSYFSIVNKRGIISKGLSIIISYLRLWDEISAKRPDKYITISNFVKKRIKKYYNINADVIYPPVNTDFFIPAPYKRQEEYFLLVSRLKPYKKIDIIVKAFNELKLPLLIIGEGNHRNYLQSIAKKNIQFLWNIDDEKLLSYYQRCKAFVFSSEEDFGIVPLEAQACGKPVIAFKGGGALETVIEGVSGEFYYPQHYKALIKAIKSFDNNKYEPDKIRKHALKFSKDRFKKQFKQNVMDFYEHYKREMIVK